MPNAAWMYHKQRPSGQLYPDMTPELQRTLEGEGWVDTPAKLDPAANNASGLTFGKVVTQEPDPRPQATEGRVLGEDLDKKAVLERGVRFLPYILARMDRLFSPDGTSIADALEDEELARLVDDMSRQELLAAHQGLDTGLGDDPALWASPMRASLFGFLRPDADYESLGGGVVMVGDDTTEAGGADTEIEDPDVSAVTLDQLKAMSEDSREVWMAEATKADIIAKLDEMTVTHKARDGKEELQEALRAALAPPTPAAN